MPISLATSICVELIDNVVMAGPATSNGFFQVCLPLAFLSLTMLNSLEFRAGLLPLAAARHVLRAH